MKTTVKHNYYSHFFFSLLHLLLYTCNRILYAPSRNCEHVARIKMITFELKANRNLVRQSTHATAARVFVVVRNTMLCIQHVSFRWQPLGPSMWQVNPLCEYASPWASVLLSRGRARKPWKRLWSPFAVRKIINQRARFGPEHTRANLFGFDVWTFSKTHLKRFTCITRPFQSQFQMHTSLEIARLRLRDVFRLPVEYDEHWKRSTSPLPTDFARTGGRKM